MYDFQPEVSRGMAWCDQHFGRDWIWRVDVERLNLRSCVDCVLGQLGGHFSLACLAHGLSIPFAIECGFALCRYSTSLGGYNFFALTATWRRAILAERDRRKLDVPREGIEGQPREGAVRVAG